MSVSSITFGYVDAGTDYALDVDSVTLGRNSDYDERYSINVANGKPIGVGKVTTAERLAIVPVNGMMVYDTDVEDIYLYVNGAWVAASGGTSVSEITSTGDTLDITDPLGPSVNIEVNDPLILNNIEIDGTVSANQVTFLASGGGGTYGHTTVGAEAAVYIPYSLILPNGQCPTDGYGLVSTTAGVMSWANVAGGGITTIGSGGTIHVTDPTGPSTTIDVNSTLSLTALTTGSVNSDSLQLNNVTNSTTLTSGATSVYTLTLPTGVPASDGEILSSNTAGIMSWIAPGVTPTTSTAMTFSCTAWNSSPITADIKWAQVGDYVMLTFPPFVSASAPPASPGYMTGTLPGGVPPPTVNCYLPVIATDVVNDMGATISGQFGMMQLMTDGTLQVSSFANNDYTAATFYFNSFAATASIPIGLPGQTIVYYVGS